MKIFEKQIISFNRYRNYSVSDGPIGAVECLDGILMVADVPPESRVSGYKVLLEEADIERLEPMIKQWKEDRAKIKEQERLAGLRDSGDFISGPN